ncbi:MAG TPA: sensor domain-containing diguanylate cyclase [Yinghuangia sp.]|uniref:sensor domain-containing diguanylate cyclase n=1 Tax=Yinghuangia sp. YIM S10712 TaxID=3436930 RepID=UPI002C9DDC4D|nr:sensor domain-containing diguanylate cyclase [Yinghuangia sp.]
MRKVVARADPHGHERPDPGGQPSGEPAGNSAGKNGSGSAPPPGGRDAARRLHAVMELAKALATAHTLTDVVRISAGQARVAMDAALASISVWERDSGHLRVLINDGDLADGEEALPHAEMYAVTDFPEIIAPATWPTAWSNTVDERDSEHERVVALRRRGRHGCMVAPIMVEGRVWGELYLARHAEQPRFDSVDAEFAAVLAAQISAGLAQAEHYQRIEKLAFTDPLTGLANRRAIDARLDAAITRHYREGTVVSLIVCDVNGLKRLNDERGHDVGDRLLERFADQLSACSAMLPGSMAARLGGDEFCVLVEGFSPDEVVAVAEELCRRALRMHDGEGVACGVASTGDPVGPVTSADRLFRLADAAQYRAKGSRAIHPVVAGRGQPPDPTVSLAVDDDAVLPADSAPAGRPHRDRRRFRGALHNAEPGRLLAAVLGALDERVPGRVHRADTLGRLEIVADTFARMLDGVSWWISYVPPQGRSLRTVRYSIHRMTGSPGAARARYEAGTAEYDLSAYPAAAEAVQGGGFVQEVGDAGNDPAEEDLLLVGGYKAMVVAGGTNAAGGWLVEIFTDELSLSAQGLAPVLRALVAVALTGGASLPE